MVTKIDRKRSSNGTKKSSKLKPWASKVAFIEICLDLGKLVFLMFSRSVKRRAKITNKSTLGRFDGPEILALDAI